MALPIRVERTHGTTDPFELMRQDFSSMLGRFFGGGRLDDGGEGGGMLSLSNYGVDIREDADHFYVEADIPGFRREDIDIRLENGALTIAAERREETPQQQQDQQQARAGQSGGQPSQGQQHRSDYRLRERRYQRFHRSFTLPPDVDEQDVQAKLEDGVLKIKLNRREETKPKKIQVN